MKMMISEIKNKYSNLGLAKRYISSETLYKIVNRTSYLNSNCGLPERFFHIENDIYKIPSCYCGKNLSWNRNINNYRKFCSTKCSANSNETKKLKLQTMIYEYGVSHNMKLDSCKDARKQTYLQNYGVDNPSKNLDIKEKKKLTCISNYGESCGVKTNQCKEAIFNKFGVYNVMHVPEISELPQRYRWKKYTLPSGKTINVQGYEPQALDELFKIYQEDEIITARKNMPIFWYILPSDNKLHRYYPDIYIPIENLIIEVKSEWTYKQYITKNKSKEQCVLDAGFKYKLLIY